MRLLLIPLMMLCSCAGNREKIAVNTTSHTEASVKKPRDLSPEQIADGLDDLCVRVRERINNTSDQIDFGADNNVRRRTLRFRMRASEVAWRAQQNTNKLAGVIELWFWMAVIEQYAKQDKIREMIGDKAQQIAELGVGLRTDVEDFAKQLLPPKGFATIKTDIEAASANGEVLTASPAREQAIIGSLLELTRLQDVLGLALSPFEALRSGGDSMAKMTVTADRAVRLMERYPEIIAWNLRLAVIDMEEQDSAREARAALQRSLQLIDEMPTRVRSEVQTILASSDPTLKEAQATLRDLNTTAASLTALTDSARQTIAAVRTLYPEPDPPGTPPKPPGRPFDIREYAAAAEAAAVTLKEARSAIEVATDKGLPAADAAAARFEAVADRVLWRIGGLLGIASLLAAAIIVLHHRLRRRT